MLDDSRDVSVMTPIGRAPDRLEGNPSVILVKRPVGIPQLTDFALEETPIEPLQEAEFRVRNLFLSVDPAQRGWASDGSNYAPPAPLGRAMRALAVGIVVESQDTEFPVGHHVYGWFGWQTYAVATRKDVLTAFANPTAPLSAYAGVLGINGLTAYLALNQIGRPAAGETILVTTAAGAVGSVVGQLARAAGSVVVGLTGNDKKADVCRERFGYDVAINYKSRPLDTLLDGIVGDGVDIFFDNVGGDFLDVILRRMRANGRIVQCGTASVPSWTPPPAGLRNEREVLTRRLIWAGFVIFDHIAKFPAALTALSEMIQSGDLTYDEDVRNGLGAAPQALADVYAGRNHGKTLIRLP
jgi:hypothetical protein